MLLTWDLTNSSWLGIVTLLCAHDWNHDHSSSFEPKGGWDVYLLEWSSQVWCLSNFWCHQPRHQTSLSGSGDQPFSNLTIRWSWDSSLTNSEIWSTFSCDPFIKHSWIPGTICIRWVYTVCSHYSLPSIWISSQEITSLKTHSRVKDSSKLQPALQASGIHCGGAN